MLFKVLDFLLLAFFAFVLKTNILCRLQIITIFYKYDYKLLQIFLQYVFSEVSF